MNCYSFVLCVFTSKKYHLLSLIRPHLVREWREGARRATEVTSAQDVASKNFVPHSTPSALHKASLIPSWYPCIICSFSGMHRDRHLNTYRRFLSRSHWVDPIVSCAPFLMAVKAENALLIEGKTELRIMACLLELLRYSLSSTDKNILHNSSPAYLCEYERPVPRSRWLMLTLFYLLSHFCAGTLLTPSSLRASNNAYAFLSLLSILSLLDSIRHRPISDPRLGTHMT